MTKTTIFKLKDFLSQYRITHQIQDETVYGQITISKSSGISFRENKIGKEIGRKRQFVIDLQKYPNTVIFTRQGIFDGSIGIAPIDVDGCIATENMPMFSIDDKKVLPELFNYFLKSSVFKDRVQELTQTGSAQKAIHERELLELAFSFPSSVIEQKKLAKKIDSRFIQISKINQQNELDRQYISQLKQSILQEAIAGQFTAEWRTENPIQKGNPDTDAAALLAKIKAEKQRLIADGKLKKEKPLAEIAIDEIPFSIPNNWVWCRLGEICLKIHYGFNASAKPNTTGVRLLRITDIQNNKVNWKNVPSCDYSDADLDRYLLNENDIVIARTGGTIGKTFLVENISEKSLFASYLIRAIPSKIISAYFLKLFMESPIYWKQLYDAAWGSGQPNVNATSLTNLNLPLPPLAEQKAIVEKVDRLMNIIDRLEQQIKYRKQLAENLMQTVLREAFE